MKGSEIWKLIERLNNVETRIKAIEDWKAFVLAGQSSVATTADVIRAERGTTPNTGHLVSFPALPLDLEADKRVEEFIKTQSGSSSRKSLITSEWLSKVMSKAVDEPDGPLVVGRAPSMAMCSNTRHDEWGPHTVQGDCGTRIFKATDGK